MTGYTAEAPGGRVSVDVLTVKDDGSIHVHARFEASP
jgi:hypothetical protein